MSDAACLEAACRARFGPLLPPEAPARVAAFLLALARTPVGVTAVRDPRQALERHVGDALRALPRVDAAPPGPLADVGSGGGVPGLVLAIARPQREVHLIEATGHKAAFLSETAAELGVHVRVHGARSEELAARVPSERAAGGALRDAFACVCARALAAPPSAAELCLPLAAPGGLVLLWVGPGVEPRAMRGAALAVGGGEPRLVEPGLVEIEKREATPARFPRRPGMASKRPLGA